MGIFEDITGKKQSNITTNNSIYENITGNKSSGFQDLSKGVTNYTSDKKEQEEKAKGSTLERSLYTGGDIISNASKGFFNFFEGITDKSLFYASKVASFITGDKTISQNISEVVKESGTPEFINKAEEFYDTKSYLKDDGLAEGVSQGIGQIAGMVLTAGTGIFKAIPGADLKGASTGLKVLSKTKELAPLYTSASGNALTQALNDGATDGEALAFGIGSGVLEAGTEIIGGISGNKIISKTALGKGLTDNLKKKLFKNASNNVISNLGKIGFEVVGEGTEEVISEFLSPYLERLTYNPDAENSTAQELLDSFVIGGVTSAILNSPSITIKRNGKTVDKTKAKEEISKTPLGEIIKEQEATKQQTEIIKKQIAPITQEQVAPTQIEKSDNQLINEFREDASNYWNETTESKALQKTIEKVIEDKGYKIDLDTNLVGTNNENVAGRIRTLKDGTTNITLNPNSTRTGEFLLMHEVTHAIETDEIKNLVMDYASKNKSFNTALESLKKTYNTEDVSSEVVADISAQLFGNQEFINGLSTTQPSLFKQIYDKIIELANKITGNSKESLFIRDLKNKWETAYRKSDKTVEEQYSLENIKITKDNVKELQKLADEKAKGIDIYDDTQEAKEIKKIRNEITKYYKEQADTRLKNFEATATKEDYDKIKQATKEQLKELSEKYNITEKQLKKIQKNITKIAPIVSKKEINKVQKELETKAIKEFKNKTFNDLESFEKELGYYIDNEFEEIETNIEYNDLNISEMSENILDSIGLKPLDMEFAKGTDEKINETPLVKKDTLSPKEGYENLVDSIENLPFKTKISRSWFKASVPSMYIDVLGNELRIATHDNGKGYDNQIIISPEYAIELTKEESDNLILKETNKIIKEEGISIDDYEGNLETTEEIKNDLKAIETHFDFSKTIEEMTTELEKINVKDRENKIYDFILEELGQKPTKKYETIKQSKILKDSTGKELSEGSFDISNSEDYDGAEKIFFRKREDGMYNLSILDENNNLLNEATFLNKKSITKHLKNENLSNYITENATDTDNYVFVSSNNNKSITNYFMQHRPTETMGYASDITDNGNIIPKNFYTNPEFYFNMKEKSHNESFNVLKMIKGNPNANITIYRTTPGKEINNGDWVTLSKEYAKIHNNSQFDGKANILELKVKAKDIQFAGDDINEFGYYPSNEFSKYSKDSAKWQEFLEQNFKATGTTTKLKDIRKITNEEKDNLDVENLESIYNDKPTETMIPISDTYDGLDRDYQRAGNQKLKAISNIHPNLKPYIQDRVAFFKSDLSLSTKGERIINSDLLHDSFGENGIYATKRDTSSEIETLLDEYKYTYQEIKDSFDNLLSDNVKNTAINKRIELLAIDSLLSEKYTTMDGLNVPTEKDFFDNWRIAEQNEEQLEIVPIQQDILPIKNEVIDSKKITPSIKITKDQIKQIADNKMIIHATSIDGLKGIVKDGLKQNESLAYYTKGTDNIAKYKGGVIIEYKADISTKIQDGKLFKGDGKYKRPNRQKVKMFDTLNEFIENNPNKNQIVKYNEAITSNIIKSNMIKKVYMPKNISNDVIELLKKNNIDYSLYSNAIKPMSSIIDDTNKTAVVLDNRPLKEQKGLTSESKKLYQKIVDRGYYIAELAEKTGNKELYAEYDQIATARGKAESDIINYQTNNNGKKIGESLSSIWQPIIDSKKTFDFSMYQLHKHNVDRMAQGKPVFGNEITADISLEEIEKYDKTNPNFSKWSEKIQTYQRNQLQNMVDAGLTSQETAEYLNETYDNYVKIYRNIQGNSPITVFNGKIKVNSPIKKATGGNQDILPLQDSMAQQTLEVAKAIRQNEFMQELGKTLGSSKAESYTEKFIKNDDGTYTATYFEKGQPRTIQINEQIYESIKPTKKAEWEDLIPVKITRKVGTIKRGLITDKNPMFLFRNFFKDVGDAPINSKYSKKFFPNFVRAYNDLMSNGEYSQLYKSLGGGSQSYFSYDKGLSLPSKSKVKGFISKIQMINEIVETAPRLAEFISSIEDGQTLETAMYNAAEVTTNFKRGGEITKILNKNFSPFLNTSVQGFDKQIRNFKGQNGAKGYAELLLKATVFGVLPSMLNHLLLGDDDDYEELSDYVKDNYYVFKTDDNNFIRIPKGRVASVFGNTARRLYEYSKGDEKAFDGLTQQNINQVAPNSPLTSNILSPLIQVATNKAWHGGDIVPTRLQSLPEGEQTDEKTDLLSTKLGELFGISPKKINYILDQYSGVIGDFGLPLLTPQAEQNPIKSAFTVNSNLSNQHQTDFYDTKEEIDKIGNSKDATEQDLLTKKYFGIQQAKMNDYYAEKREVQNSDYSDKIKLAEVERIQSDINLIAKDTLTEYKNQDIQSNYARIDDEMFYKNNSNEWTKVDDDGKDSLNKALNMFDITENEYFQDKTAYNYATKYSDNKNAYNEYKAREYIKEDIGYGNYSQNIATIKSNTKNDKVETINYINGLDLSIPEKAIFIKQYYSSFNNYNSQIYEYIKNKTDITTAQKNTILRELGVIK